MLKNYDMYPDMFTDDMFTDDMSGDDRYDYSSDEEENKKVSFPPVKEKVKTNEEIENELKEIEEFKKKVSPFLNWVRVSSTVSESSFNDNKFPKLGEKVDKSWVEVKQKKKTKKEETSVKKDVGNTRTKMCSYTKCPHGVKCRFAHSTKELNILECMFDGCKLVRSVGDDKYVNTHRNKRCDRRHKNESDVNFFIRTGIKDLITDEEIKDAYTVFTESYNLLTPEMHESIEKCPCDKMVSFFGVFYCGKASPSEPVIRNYKKQVKYKEIKQKEIRCKEIKKIKVNTVSNVKYQKENPQTVYIRKRNEKIFEIKSLKTVITRTQDAINRLKQQKNYSMIKKYEDEYMVKIEKLTVLEQELSEIKIEKIEEVKEKEEIKEEIKEDVKEVKKEVKENKLIVLEIILPKKKEEIQSSSDSESDPDSEIESSIRNITIPSNLPIQPPSSFNPNDDGVGWVSIENKVQKKKPSSPKPVKKPINIPANSFKSQMCRSLTTVPKSKCPHGDKCRYAHNINELLCNVKECGFGATCKLVAKDTVVGEYKNIGYKICSYKHPMESKNSYIRRNKY